MVQEEKYCEAFNRLNMLFLHLAYNMTYDQVCVNRYSAFTLSSSLDWISKTKYLIDEIIEGIGGEGFGISASNYGISISVSFGTGKISTQSTSKADGRPKKESML